MKLLFMGRKAYSAQLLEWTAAQGIEIVAVCTDDQFPNSPTAAKARQMGIPVLSMEAAEELLEKGTQVDLAVSYLYWRKIRRPLIELPKYGCINFHPAILPDWRGCGGYNVAILNGLTQWGGTAHYVNESIDTGGIIKVSRFPMDPDAETVVTLERKTQETLMELYREVILSVREKGVLPSEAQDMSAGVYISRQQMEDMKAIDLNKDNALTIDRKIRAFWFPPYDGANIVVDGKRYTLLNSDILKTLVPPDTTSMA